MIDKKNIEDIYPMSDIAGGMAFYSLKDPGSGIYHNQSPHHMKDTAFQPGVLDKALRLLVRKHPILRTGFKVMGVKEPAMIVFKEMAPETVHQDIASWEPQRREEHIEALLAQDKARGFDFNGGQPLWRIKTFNLGNGEVLFIWIAHHAMIDGWSTAVLMTEINNTYRMLKTDSHYTPGQLKSSYKEYVVRERAQKKEGNTREFWKNELAEFKRLLFPGGDSHGSQRKQVLLSLPPELHGKLKETAARYHTGIKELCFAAYLYMMGMISYDDDFVVGLITNNRPMCEDSEKIIGCFLNTVPVRLPIPPGIRWGEYIQLVKDKLLKLKRHEGLPLLEINKLVHGDAGEGNPLTDTIFNFVDFHVYGQLQREEPPQSGVQGAPPLGAPRAGAAGGNVPDLSSGDAGVTNTLFDVSVDVTRGRFMLSILFAPFAVPGEVARKMCRYFENLLGCFVYQPDQVALNEHVLTEEEMQVLLEVWNRDHADWPLTATLPRIFEEQALRFPDRTAVSGPLLYADRRESLLLQLTYGELDRRARLTASRLLEKGVGPGSIVGLIAEPSVFMLTSLLGILKAGAAYLPIAPDCPPERVDYMLRDANVRLLITDHNYPATERIPDCTDRLQTCPYDQQSAPGCGKRGEIPPEAPAYVIYTSGSTGKPKGVVIPHRALVNRMYWIKENYRLDRRDVSLLKAPFTFDVSVCEIFRWILPEARLHILSAGEEKEPAAILGAVARFTVTIIEFVPSMLKAFLETLEPGEAAGQAGTLRWVFTGAEVAPPALVESFNRLFYPLTRTRLINAYGPTEATVGVTYHDCTGSSFKEIVPIGRPMSNTGIFLLNSRGMLQPAGVSGEIVITGSPVALGYLNRPVLTAEKFPNAGKIGEEQEKNASPSFRTGDLGRWTPEGNLQFLGRIDRQVKIRGHRIEPGEIEARLTAHEGVEQACVVDIDDPSGGKHLCAYVVSGLTTQELRRYLSETLPGYMVPGRFIPVERIPLTSSGKVDPKALPPPDASAPGAGEPYVPPANEIEETVARVWREVMALDRVGTGDNFFHIGGDSIKAIQLVSRLKKHQLAVDINQLFQYPTIRELVPHIRREEDPDRAAKQETVVGEVPFTPIQHYFFQHHDPGRRHTFCHSIMFFNPGGFDEDRLRQLLTQLVLHHDALRMVYPGESGNIGQRNRGNEEPLFHLDRFDFTGEPEPAGAINRETARIQESMNLSTGPLVKLGLFRISSGDHLLLVIHHLVVDGISWRILLEDLTAGFALLEQGKELRFPLKTASFREWALRLQAHAAEPNRAMREELEYWKTIDTLEVEPLVKSPRPHAQESGAAGGSFTVSLEEEETRQLLHRVNRAYHTEINDILLTALGLAVCRWSGSNRAAVNLEGHGREFILEGLDISRTAGWFTSFYPLVLEFREAPGTGLETHIIDTKETLRRVPNKGIGYGILKYLTPPEQRPGLTFNLEPEISFNYLGRFDGMEQEQKQAASDGGLQVSSFGTGGGGTDGAMVFKIDINGMIRDGRLVFTFTFDTRYFEREGIRQLSDRFRSGLSDIIRHCAGKKETQRTLSDFKVKGASQEDIEVLFQHLQHIGTEAREVEQVYNLAPMQENMLYHYAADKNSPVYFEQMTVSLAGRIDIERFEEAYNRLVQRYDILRTIFVYEATNLPLQVVFKTRHAGVAFEDISDDPAIRTPEEKHAWVEDFKQRDRETGFRLDRDIPMRVTVIKTGAQDYRLIWSSHHIIMDGWCMSIVIRDFLTLYRALLAGEEPRLAPAVPYGRFLEWLQRQDKEAARDYWKSYLRDIQSPAQLPRFGLASGEGARDIKEHAFGLGASITGKLKHLAAGLQTTLFVYLQCLWGLLLQRYNNTHDVVFGVVVSGRPPEIPDVESIVGLFINTVPARITAPPDRSLEALLREVHQGFLASKQYEYASLPDIQAASPLKADLFDHIMVYENFPVTSGTASAGTGGETGFGIREIENREQTNYAFDIAFLPGEELKVVFNYDASVYEGAVVRRLGEHFKRLARITSESPEMLIEEIDFLGPEEKKTLLEDFNGTAVSFDTGLTIHGWFEKQAETSPDKVAATGPSIAPGFSHGTSALTYRQLSLLSGALAWELRQKGLVPGMVAAIMVERSVEMMIALLGVLKAGAAYLPLDGEFPPERIQYMLSDANARVLITGPERITARTDRFVTCPNSQGAQEELVLFDVGSIASTRDRLQTCPYNQEPAPGDGNMGSGSDAAYIIYTSGSTGKPKGVLVEHASVVNRMHFMKDHYRLGPDDVILQASSFIFDVSVCELFRWIAVGGRVCFPVHGAEKEPRRLLETIGRHCASTADFAAPLLRVLLDVAVENREIRSLASLCYLFTGVDVVDKDLVERFGRHVSRPFGTRLVNAYGPTEAAVDVTHFSCTAGEPYGIIPIGKPIDNVRIHILDEAGRMQPVGAPGELCIAGAAVARGYLNRPELTAEKFTLSRREKPTDSALDVGANLVFAQQAARRPPSFPSKQKHPHQTGDSRKIRAGAPFSLPNTQSPIPGTGPERLYHSGDLARWLPDGNIQFLGRVDRQVKIRGFRIELSEIEARLLKHPEVKEACVIDRRDNSGNNYLCAYAVPAVPPDFREFLSQTLPGYMLPTHAVSLDTLPLTLAGKVNPKALPAPDTGAPGADDAPADEIEARLIEIWAEVLDLPGEGPGVRTDFFQAGGHSLKATILATKIHRAFDVKIPLADIFNAPTIREMAGFIRSASPEQFAPIEPVEQKEVYPLSSAQGRLYILQQFDSAATAYNIPTALEITGPLDTHRFENAWKQLIQRHDILRTSFPEINGQPVQRVHEHVDFDVSYEINRDPRHGGGPSGQEIPTAYHPRPAAFIRPFVLSEPPLLRVELTRLGPGKHLLMFDMHHIINDGTSNSILTGEFVRLYNGETPATVKLQYKDFTSWQNRMLSTGAFQTQERYWMERFADIGDLPVLNLPADFTRPPEFQFRGGYEPLVLEEGLTRRLKKSTLDTGTTLFMNVLAAVYALLEKYTGLRDMVFGTGTAGRRHASLQDMPGLFVNMLALRAQPSPWKTFEQLLEEVKHTCLDAYDNQDIQFEDLVDKLDIQRDASRNPLFDVTVVEQNFQRSSYRLDDLAIQPYGQGGNSTAKFDFTLFATDAGEKIHLLAEYYTGIFKRETLQRLLGHLARLLDLAVQSPRLLLAEIDILSDKEKQQLLNGFNDTRAPFPTDTTVHRLFRQQAERSPHRVAAVDGDNHVSYRYLERTSNRLAGFLFHEKRLRPGEPVGILLDRNLHRPAAILGVLGAGGAYVPMDPTLPEERLKTMVTDAAVPMVLSQKKYLRTLNRLQWECPAFDAYLCMDSSNIHGETEPEQSTLMDTELWHHVAETSVDDITGGGWTSSYTGLPLRRDEMDEYGDNILSKLGPLLHKEMRVLEIGCASGISMYRIAPKVGYYLGTDLSEVIIRKNRERVRDEGQKNVALQCLPAHRIDELEEGDFHLVIINSVIQCFPGHHHLRRVIAKCLEKMTPGGWLFIGDVMDLDRKQELLKDLQAFKRADIEGKYTTKTDFSQELFVPPAFFHDLPAEFPAIQGVTVSEKTGTIGNELTRFRYDVLLSVHKEKKKPAAAVKKHKYQHGVTCLSPYGTTAPPVAVGPRDPAYIIYTSGTTGVPKGVLVEHPSLLNLCYWHNRYYEVTAADRATLYAGFGFDASVWELFPYLISGASLHLIPGELKLDIDGLHRYFESRGITIGFLPTQLCEQFMELEHKNLSLRVLLTGGDKLRRFTPRNYTLYNNYGPTENTVVTTAYPVRSLSGNIPIGPPIANTRIYILHKETHRLQPVGVPGELCISGDSLARGYLNDPELTSERFSVLDNTAEGPQSFNRSYRSHRSYLSYPGARLYSTGDLARWLPDGNIRFLGRVDRQVKIRGFRIELSEIEARLLKHPEVEEACVIDRRDSSGNTYLCAYAVPAVPPDLREFLSRVLPDYMLPTHAVSLDTLPLTHAGKVNRKALPAPDIAAPGDDDAPADEVEARLIEIWAEVLDLPGEGPGVRTDFFQAGGHSLKATILATEIHRAFDVKIPLADIFNAPTIREMAGFIRSASTERFASIEPAEKKELYPLSSAQKRLYILQRMLPSGVHYNIPLAVRLEGPLEVERLNSVFNRLIQRHEALRTSFHMLHGEPVQRVHDRVDFLVEERTGMEEISDGELLPFDLTQAPLIRVVLGQTAPRRRLMLVDMHHIISDGTSHGVLTADFAALYNDTVLPPLRLQYRDFARWQHLPEQVAATEAQKEWWGRVFREEAPGLELPLDFPRPALQSFEGDAVTFEIPEEQTRALLNLAAAENLTLFMVLLGIFNILLSKLSGREDIVVGTPVAGRRHADLHAVIGMFVNTLPLRNFPSGETGALTFLHDTGRRCLEAFENQEYPFEELVEHLDIPRDAARNPLFGTMFALQNFQAPAGAGDNHIPGLTISPANSGAGTVKFDLDLSMAEAEGGLSGILYYCVRLFKRDTARRFTRYFVRILTAVPDDPGAPISHIDIMSERELRQLVVEFNRTDSAYPGEKTLHRLFREQVQRTPGAAALTGPTPAARGCPGTTILTYASLGQKVINTARRLTETGVGEKDIVALIMERSPAMVAAVLAVLEAGAAYLPIDPQYPAGRIAYILADSNTPLVITDNPSAVKDHLKGYTEGFVNRPDPPGGRKEPLVFDIGCIESTGDRLETLSASCSYQREFALEGGMGGEDSLAYVIYTSGSTGRPKGVAVEHGSAVNMIMALQEKYPMPPGGGYLLKTPAIFDISAAEIFGWFFNGGRLIVLGEGKHKEPGEILAAVERFYVTHINFVPSLLGVFLQYLSRRPGGVAKTASLEYILTAGEVLPPEHVAVFRELCIEAELVNLYGPTEATVYTSWYETSHWPGEGSVSIGSPLPDYRLYILDRWRRPLPIGVPGELCIAGAGITRGYINRPEMTAEKFTMPPAVLRGLSEGQGAAPPGPPTGKKEKGDRQEDVLYHTGDLACWGADGNIEFLGRIDHQVKIRGFRIELGEIENHLLRHPKVKAAVVTARAGKGGDKYLCAYYTSKDAEFPPVGELKTFLAEHLPGYMVPAHFVQLEQMPLAPNGKVNRAKLPSPEISTEETYVPPANETEEKLAAVWAAVLDLEPGRTGVETNFFDLGGHSLALIKMNAEIHEVFGKDIPITDMFRLTTIRALAGRLHDREVDARVSGDIMDEAVEVMDETLSLFDDED